MLITFKVAFILFESKVWVSVKMLGLGVDLHIAKISATSSIVFNMPTRELWVAETENSFFNRFDHLNNKNYVCKQTSSL